MWSKFLNDIKNYILTKNNLEDEEECILFYPFVVCFSQNTIHTDWRDTLFVNFMFETFFLLSKRSIQCRTHGFWFFWYLLHVYWKLIDKKTFFIEKSSSSLDIWLSFQKFNVFLDVIVAKKLRNLSMQFCKFLDEERHGKFDVECPLLRWTKRLANISWLNFFKLNLS